jgi:hypothetical protein
LSQLTATTVIARSESDEAIHLDARVGMDCFASLAMTAGLSSLTVSQREFSQCTQGAGFP